MLRRAREVVGREVIESVPGWAEAADRMNAEYQAPTVDDAVDADAVLFGTPTRFGLVTSELKAYLDSLGGAWFQGKLNGKAAGAFTSTQTLHGGNENTILSLYAPLAHLGFIIVPTGYSGPSLLEAGTPYGASAYAPKGGVQLSEADIAVAKYQGKRTVEIARALKAGK